MLENTGFWSAGIVKPAEEDQQDHIKIYPVRR